MGWDRSWAPYKPVAQRRAEAAQMAKKFTKKGGPLVPVRITGRAMATTFWGNAWCDNLECYSDFSNRLPRGRSYARNGSIIDLKIVRGEISALVSGSSLYKIKIAIDPLNAKRWKNIRTDCSSSICSLLDLMRGKFSEAVMRRLTDAKTGLFPEPKEIKMSCSCPDSARLCKHLAAVMYGIGHRLDNSPEMFFELRGLDHRELIEEALMANKLDEALGTSEPAQLASEDLGAMFGIDLVSSSMPESFEVPKSKKSKTRKASATIKSSKPKSMRAALVEAKPKRLKQAAKPSRVRSVAQPASIRSATATKAKTTVDSKPKAKGKVGTKAR